MSLLSSFVCNASWATALFISQMLHGLVVQATLLSVLTTASYGSYALIVASIAALTPIFSLSGLSNSLMNGVAAVGIGDVRGVFRLKLAAGVLAGAVVAVVSVALYSLGWSQDLTVCLVLALVAPAIWMDVHLALWQGQRRFAAIFIEGVIVRLLSLTVLLAILTVRTDVFAVVIALVVLPALVGMIQSIRIVVWAPTVPGTGDLRFGWHLWRLGVILGVLSQLDKIVLGAVDGVEMLAVFAVSELVFRYGFTIPSGILSQVVQPKFAAMNPNEAVAWIRRYRLLFVAVFVVMGVMAASALTMADRFLLSQKYESATKYAWAFAACVALRAPSALLGALFKAHERRRAINATAVILAINHLLSPLGFLIAGLPGLMSARLVGSFAVGVVYIRAQRLDDVILRDG